MNRPAPPGERRDRFRGCLLGGAVGDALGAPVEFLSLAEINTQFGPAGIQDFAPAYGRLGAITDDTQMTLFTAEGLLRSMLRFMQKGISGAEVGLTKHAYMRWLETQGCPLRKDYKSARAQDEKHGWLITHRELFSQRAPGNTCISALLHTDFAELRASNGSKGCGAVMRMAPAAMFTEALVPAPYCHPLAFELGCDLAAITHGHPTGQVAAGMFAVAVLALLQGSGVEAAIMRALAQVHGDTRGDETFEAVCRALVLFNERVPPEKAIPQLGEGWIAEEALAIAFYCTLVASDFPSGVTMAVNIDGDSDSVGAISGNLLGALHGGAAIPPRWLEQLELREVITEMADDFLLLSQAPASWLSDDVEALEYWWERYPGY